MERYIFKYERILETIDPSIAIERARKTYLIKGYTDEWINARIKGIPVRNELTYEWRNRGITNNKDFSILTDEYIGGRKNEFQESIPYLEYFMGKNNFFKLSYKKSDGKFSKTASDYKIHQF